MIQLFVHAKTATWGQKALKTALLAGSFLLGSLPIAAMAADSIETVVVTAEKRAEPIQHVPISVAVVGQETLKAFDMNQATDLQYLVPSVTLTNSAGPRNFGFFIRGIGTSSFASESIEGSTGYVLDGVVLGQAGASLIDLPDVDHIEVLRGPQGTLFGKNASAGVINVTTQAPSDVLEMKGGVEWAEPDNERKVSGVVSGPISDDLKFLVSARLNQTDGYITNVFDGRKLNNRNDWGARGKLEYTPNDRLDIMFIGDFWKRDANCCIWTLRSVGKIPTAPEAMSLAKGIVPGPDNRKQDIDGPVFADEESYGASVQADYRLGGGYTLTSITAWRRWTTKDGLDSDNSPLNLLDVNFARFNQHQTSEELRIASPTGGFLDYVAGLYYFDQHVTAESIQQFPTVRTPFMNKVADNIASTRNAAVFGQANLNFTKSFRAILGARVLNERDTATKDRRDPVLKLTSAAHASKSPSAVVWRTGLQYDVNSNTNFFATVTRGYKGGGFDTNTGVGTLPNVKPEVPTDYELGMRSAWPDERAVFNVTVFDDRVKGYQASGRDPATTAFFIVNANARTRGVEFDSTWLPLEGVDWTLNGSGSYVDAKWGKFPNASCYNGQTVAQGCVGGVQNVSGLQLPFAPKWTLNFSSHYDRPFPLQPDWRIGFNLGMNYRSKQGIQFPNNPNTIQAGYALWNASISLAGQDDRWRLAIFGKNLTDQRYEQVIFATPFGSVPGGYSGFIPYEAQRIIGVSLDVAN